MNLNLADQTVTGKGPYSIENKEHQAQIHHLTDSDLTVTTYGL